MSSIERIPSEEAPPPWDEALEAISLLPVETGKFVRLVAPDLGESQVVWVKKPPQLLYLQLNEATLWEFIRHWFFKKTFNSKHKVPRSPRDLRDATEPFGELLRSLYELCKECHAFPSPISSQYQHASYWFVAVALEVREVFFAVEQADTKPEHIQALRNMSQNLKNRINPFPAYKLPHLSGLIEVSQDKQKHLIAGKDFAEKYMNFVDRKTGKKGLIPAFASCVSTLQDHPIFKRTEVDEMGLSYPAGRGKGKIRASPEQLKNRVAGILTG